MLSRKRTRRRYQLLRFVVDKYQLVYGVFRLEDLLYKILRIVLTLDNTCWGSYMHGILDNPEVLDNLAEGFDKETTDHPFDYAAFKEEQYDKLANLVRKHVDMDYIYRQLV